MDKPIKQEQPQVLSKADRGMIDKFRDNMETDEGQNVSQSQEQQPNIEVENELNFVSPIARSEDFDLGFRTGYVTAQAKYQTGQQPIEDIELLAKSHAREIYKPEEQGNKIVYFYAGACFAVNEMKQLSQQEQPESEDDTDFYKDDFNSLTDRILRDKGASNMEIYEANNYAFAELKKQFTIKRK